MVELARRRLARFGDRARLSVGVGERITAADETYDAGPVRLVCREQARLTLTAGLLEPSGQREQDEHDHDQRGGRHAHGAKAAVTQTATKQSEQKENNEEGQHALV